MSKNRDRRPTGKPPSVSPGGEVDGVGDVDGVDSDDDMMDTVDVKSSEKNRLQRAEMHLAFLIQEITALANEGAFVGAFRRACAECQMTFNDSNAALWQPLKSVKMILEKMKGSGS